jgi:4-amino-4-deoxy-L-arabinose transferase-like glycosyltransferase
MAWRLVGLAVLAACCLLAATMNQYGYDRDELYFRMLRPAWGYVDQPPMTPMLAKLSTIIFGDTVWGLRIPAVIMIAVAIVLAAATTRELGGDRTAQAFAAWGFAFATMPLVTGHLLITATADFALWAGALLCVARALLRGQPRWWFAAGTVVGIAMYNKLLISMLVVCLAIGIVAIGPRSVLRSGHLWGGVGLAVLIGSPNLIYQVTHHFPQLTMAIALHNDKSGTVTVETLPYQVLLVGAPLLPVWITGIVSLFRRPEWRPIRVIAVAYLVAVVLTAAAGIQVYYAFGLQAFVLAAGWIPAVEWLRRAAPPDVAWRRAGLVASVAANALLSAIVALPMLPPDVVAHTPVIALNQTVGDQVGWPQYVRILASAYHTMSADDRAHAMIYASNYGEAGAVARFGPQYGLPPVYSAQNELYNYGPPPPDRTEALVWGKDPNRITAVFGACLFLAMMDDGYDIPNEEQGTWVARCHVPPLVWAPLWPDLRHYG